MNSGIYFIQSLSTNRLYIGLANNFDRRKSEHYSDLRGNRHGNSHLQNLFNKYGEDDLTFGIIEYISETNYDLLNEREKHVYNVYKLAGYDMINIYEPDGKRHFAKHRENIGKSVFKMKVAQINCETLEVIKIWDSMSLASKTLGIIRSGITKACRKEYKSAGGYKWEYVDTDKLQHASMQSIKMSPESIARQAVKRSKPVVQLNKETGEIIKIWPSASAVEQEISINHSHIGECCKGQCKSAGGYRWEYYKKDITE